MDQAKIDLPKAMELVSVVQSQFWEGKDARTLPVVDLRINHGIHQQIRSTGASRDSVRCWRTA